MTPQRTIDLLLIAIAAIAVGAIYQYAKEFYEATGDAQLDHLWYDRWRPAGVIGRALGTAAVAAFLFNLAYGLRRRLRSWHSWGHLRLWMSAHVFLGLLGGGLLLLHSSFRMTSPVAQWSAWAVIVLVGTGVVGRYLYAMVPHTAFGEEDPDGLRARTALALRELRQVWPQGHAATEELAACVRVDQRASHKRGAALLLLGPLRPLARRIRVQLWLRRAPVRPPPQVLREVRVLAAELLAHAQDLAVATVAASLLARWRLVHLLAAALMVATAVWHIKTAFDHDYRWDLPGPLSAWGGGLSALLLGFAAHEMRWRYLHRRGQAKARIAEFGPPPEPPPTLHPWVDLSRCMASAACVASCPEGDILALVEGRAQLAEPSHCIGHATCATNCPVGAITLVLGSLKRGVDIPDVGDNFEASTPGIFLAGELTGMGLIRNAVEQANQAVAFIARDRRRDPGEPPTGMLDLLVVGAGPAGLAAAFAAQECGLNYLCVEQEPDVGGAVRHYPRRKLVMMHPMRIALHGNVRFFHLLKEDLIAFYRQLTATHRPALAFGVAVTSLAADPCGVGFAVQGDSGGSPVHWRARRVLLCLGRRGTPMRLGVPGENQAHVAYALQDPEQMRDRAVCVVGGGDSALEAAIACSEAGARSVHLVHRRGGFDRARGKNRDQVQRLAESGRICLQMDSTVGEIHADCVTLAGGERLPADDVLILVGGTLPTGLLHAAGVHTRTHFGRPLEHV